LASGKRSADTDPWICLPKIALAPLFHYVLDHEPKVFHTIKSFTTFHGKLNFITSFRKQFTTQLYQKISKVSVDSMKLTLWKVSAKKNKIAGLIWMIK